MPLKLVHSVYKGYSRYKLLPNQQQKKCKIRKIVCFLQRLFLWLVKTAAFWCAKHITFPNRRWNAFAAVQTFKPYILFRFILKTWQIQKELKCLSWWSFPLWCRSRGVKVKFSLLELWKRLALSSRLAPSPFLESLLFIVMYLPRLMNYWMKYVKKKT